VAELHAAASPLDGKGFETIAAPGLPSSRCRRIERLQGPSPSNRGLEGAGTTGIGANEASAHVATDDAICPLKRHSHREPAASNLGGIRPFLAHVDPSSLSPTGAPGCARFVLRPLASGWMLDRREVRYQSAD